MEDNSIDALTQPVERQWRVWLEDLPENAAEISGDTLFATRCMRVWEASEYVAQSCQRDPGLLLNLFHQGALDRPCTEAEMESGLSEILEGASDESALHRALRHFRRQQMVRIIWRDLDGSASLAETLESLSLLADACIRQTLEILYGWMLAKVGVPRDDQGRAQRLMILAMGKLGARELNLSSDIDLIFAYPAQGEVDGPRYLSNEQFFIRLCQQLIKALNAQTAEGFVFRVDARLRPFGESGALAMSFAAMENYYQSQAREWERYAMIKARVVSGDEDDRVQLMAMLRPFVYRRYLDFGMIESIRDMKQLISRELKRKGMADNIKLGPGGIREIEFIGQAFQLIRGGRDPELQIRPIMQVLELLSDKQLLPDYVTQELSDAYQFLRLTENRLQAWQDRQTHLLPDDAPGRLRLARAMGYPRWEEFFDQLERHRARVQGHFDMVFAAPQTKGDGEERQLLTVWGGGLDEEEAVAILKANGFQQGAAAWQLLQGFRNTHAYRSIGSKGAERLDQLMPLLLEAVAGVENPEVTLERLLKFLDAIARRTAYLALLVESPIVLSQLVRLTNISPWIAQQISRQPILLDELLDPRQLYSPLGRQDLEVEMSTLLSAIDADDLEQRMERMRQFAQSNMLRVASADLTGVIPLMVVSDFLTEIAEVVTGQVMEQAWMDLTSRHGRPTEVIGEKGFAVIGYGKLGGIELGYGSDLDLVFLQGSSNPNAMTDGDRQIANDLFYARMGQRMIHMFTTRTPAGILYEVDMRLRPNGNAGLLVSSLEAFERYQREDAWTWEHQALIRARPVAGDPEVIERFQRIRREVLSRERDPDRLRHEIRDMRKKMRDALDKSAPGQFDIKQGCGGIADIEFMVQYAVLQWGNQYPDLLDWTDNIRLLERLSSHSLLEGQTAEILANTYRVLRAAYHRNALGELPGLIPDGRLREERKMVMDIWQSLVGE